MASDTGPFRGSVTSDSEHRGLILDDTNHPIDVIEEAENFGFTRSTTGNLEIEI
jgi:hypothetical protein